MTIDQHKQVLSEQAERMIDDQLKLLAVSLDGRLDSAYATINTILGLRILDLDRCHALKDQAKAISDHRKGQIRRGEI